MRCSAVRLASWCVGLGVLLGLAAGSAARASEPAYASAWFREHSTAARLIGGRGMAEPGEAAGALWAGVEITLDEGWKTYWRNPGSSGVPPRLDWAGSENLAEAILHFPAPERFADKEGDTIGYKRTVVLPVQIKPKDVAKPVVLKLALEYGVCREVCIPVQPNLTLTVPPGPKPQTIGAPLAQALARVPRDAKSRRPNDPLVTSIRVELGGAKPKILIVAEFPGSNRGADVFLEAPEGLWVPLAKSVAGETGTTRTFVVDLTDGADLADLKGRFIRLTLVGQSGQSETSFKLE